MTASGEGAAPRDVVVVGGGAVGLAAAWQAARAGCTVTVLDPHPGRAASWAAAGMLAPVTEVHYGEEALLALNLAAARRYPGFVADLEAATGLDVGYRTSGTLAVAMDGDDAAVLRDLHDFQLRLGLTVEPLRASQCRAREPLLSPRVRAGLLVAGDHQVDNRRLVAALLEACARAGVEVLADAAAAVTVAGERVTGVRTTGDTHLTAAHVVLAAGCWSGRIDGLPEHARPRVRPVKGQILRLRGPAGGPLLAGTVRGLVHGNSVYLVPRADGELVIGATVEEQGFDTRVTAGAVHELLRDAYELVPGIAELELVEALAGLRPGSPDNAPLIGPGALEGLVVATGHHRNGILLAPLTADAVTALVTGAAVPEAVRPFRPDRAMGRT